MNSGWTSLSQLAMTITINSARSTQAPVSSIHRSATGPRRRQPVRFAVGCRASVCAQPPAGSFQRATAASTPAPARPHGRTDSLRTRPALEVWLPRLRRRERRASCSQPGGAYEANHPCPTTPLYVKAVPRSQRHTRCADQVAFSPHHASPQPGWPTIGGRSLA